MEVAKRGGTVSLNTTRRLYFFQGKDGINLRVGEGETAVIPQEISDDNLGRINQAIRMQYLVLGGLAEKKVVITKEENIGEILQQGRPKIEDFMYALKNNKSIKNEDKITRLEKLLELEKSGKNRSGKPRKSVVDKIEYYLSNMAGVSSVVEEKEKEEVKINLTKGTEEKTE